jgi:hypothetical protein
MSTTQGVVRTARLIVRVALWIEVGLGVLFWTGHGDELIAVHVCVGLALILALETLAVMAMRAQLKSWVVIVGICWGVLVPVFGLIQGHLLRASGHWLIQLAHLAAGLIAVILAETIAARLLRTPTPADHVPGTNQLRVPE